MCPNLALCQSYQSKVVALYIAHSFARGSVQAVRRSRQVQRSSRGVLNASATLMGAVSFDGAHEVE